MTTPAELPPIVSVIGRKNSGKTTLTVALAAELKQRGLWVASMKHGHHEFEFDQPGRDSWRHFHQGGVEAVIMASSGKVAMVMRTDEAERDPLGLLHRFYGGRGYDLVLVEGFKHGPFPKIEVYRSEVHDSPIYDGADGAAPHLALVTDVPARFDVAFPVLALRDDASHVTALADLLMTSLVRSPSDR